MAEERFGDVPLNVVVDDFTKLLDEDIERVNKWIRIKRVFLIALVAYSIIHDIFHTVLLIFSCFYLFTMALSMIWLYVPVTISSILMTKNKGLKYC